VPSEDKEKQQEKMAMEAVLAVAEYAQLESQQAVQKTGEAKQEKKSEKPTNEMKRDRWETQLLERMEKHDELMAQKAKIESATRMKPERKAERLVSIERRIKQNEKAQAILNRKLAILEATKNRDDWKKIKQEERRDYVDMNAEQKKQRAKMAALPKDAPVVQTQQERSELKDVKQLKQESYVGYRFATQVSKMTSKSLQKLRDVKRQNTIFELSYIVREKIALEKAIKTEQDMFRYIEMRDRLQELKRQKVALVVGFRAVKPKKKAKTIGPVQQMLPGMEQ